MAVKRQQKKAKKDPAPRSSVFPVVGIGASAGGLEAVSSLFQHLPPDPGMSFVVVIHHDHRTASDVGRVLSRSTSLAVTTIGEQKRFAVCAAIPQKRLHDCLTQQVEPREASCHQSCGRMPVAWSRFAYAGARAHWSVHRRKSSA